MYTADCPLLTAPELATAQLPPYEAILDPILGTKSLALLYGDRKSVV